MKDWPMPNVSLKVCQKSEKGNVTPNSLDLKNVCKKVLKKTVANFKKKKTMIFLKRFLSSATSDALKKRQQELMSRSLPKKKTLSGVDNVILVASGKGEMSF